MNPVFNKSSYTSNMSFLSARTLLGDELAISSRVNIEQNDRNEMKIYPTYTI